MRDLDADGQERHWIFEIHFVEARAANRRLYEELLTLG
jgi:hypothetical protein